MGNLTPTPKVSVAALVGAVVVIVTWIVNVIWHINTPVELGSSLTAIIMLVAAYLKRDKSSP